MSALSVVVTEREVIRNCVRVYHSFAKSVNETPEVRFNSARKNVLITESAAWLTLNPETATVDDVRRVMRNYYWVALQCDECDSEVKQAIEIDLDGNPYFVCQSCLLNAAKRLA